VLDYDNEYANLIINHNLSYETVALNEKTKNEAGSKALLPAIVEKFLNRRIYFEEISKELPEESREYLWCQQRLDSLKNIYFQCQVLQFPFSNFVVLTLTN
jgi:DNA polymerase elongation subunit (family B)